MALMNCDECGKELSEYATLCPHCGAPAEIALQTFRREQERLEQERLKQELLEQKPVLSDLLGFNLLSDAEVESLSKHEGELDLSLTILSDTAAESLSKHKGDLCLDGLTELSAAAAQSLSKHKGEINGENPKEWAEEFKANQ